MPAWPRFAASLSCSSSAPLLGRLLDAADFGLVATAAPIFAFVTMVQQMGFNQAIVQRHVLSKGQTDALFWLSAGFSLTLAAALVLLSGPIAGFFREPRLAGLIQAGAVLVVVSVAASQPIALLSRELRFKTIAYLDMLGSILGTVLAVAAAWLTRSYWALLLPFAAASLVNFVGGAIGARWHPGRPVWDKATREMIGFGTHVSLFNIVNFLARNADNLMIAKAHGATALGFYDRAYRLMLLPLTQATMPMSRVLTPILSRLRTIRKTTGGPIRTR